MLDQCSLKCSGHAPGIVPSIDMSDARAMLGRCHDPSRLRDGSKAVQLLSLALTALGRTNAAREANREHMFV